MHALVVAAALLQLPVPPQAPAPPQAPPVRETVSEAKRIVPACVKVGAEWCGPCRRDDPVVRQLKADGWNMHFIDSDDSPAWAANHRVSSLPTYILFDKSGKELRRHVGSFNGSRQAMIAWLGRESLPDELYNAKPSGFTSEPRGFDAKPAGLAAQPVGLHNENDLHSHRCSSCGTVWWHSGTQAAQSPRSHNCPRCGRAQYVVHSWADE